MREQRQKQMHRPPGLLEDGQVSFDIFLTPFVAGGPAEAPAASEPGTRHRARGPDRDHPKATRDCGMSATEYSSATVWKLSPVAARRAEAASQIVTGGKDEI
jgi:hypothetical protein